MQNHRHTLCSYFATAVLGLALSAPNAARAAPGDLDQTFGIGGKVAIGVGSAVPGMLGHDGRAAVTLTDGRIVSMGSALLDQNTLHPKNTIVLARFLPNGELDAGFGVRGKVIAVLPVSFKANSIAAQADGKIVVAGNTSNDSAFDKHLSDIAVTRFNVDGSLDIAFGNGGLVLTDFFGGEDWANVVVIQPDGKILVGGWAETSSWLPNHDFVLARYLPDGSLDTSFGLSGKQSTEFYGLEDHLQGLTLQPDGKIVAVGGVGLLPPVTNGEAPYDYKGVALARYHPDGSLDLGFGSGGRTHTEFYNEQGYIQSSTAQAVALQADGKIVITGHKIIDDPYGKSRNIILARYLQNGGLDLRFGRGGRVVADIGSVDTFGHALLVQPDSKIVVGGNHAIIYPYNTIKDRHFLLLRYHANGAPDIIFGSAGSAITTFYHQDFYSTEYDSVSAILQQTDGRLIATGTVASGFLGFGLARYLNPAPLAVVIDIRPGTYPNIINLGSGGKVGVAILGSTSFDVTAIDTSTLSLAAARVGIKNNGTTMTAITDVNSDGRPDLVAHFETELLPLIVGDAEAVLEGRTYDGKPIRGTDSVFVLP